MFKSALLILTLGICTCTPAAAAEWRVAGHDLANSRSQPAEERINPANVHSLSVKWVFTTGGNGNHYMLIPDGQEITWGAWSALDAATGKLIWQTPDPTSGAADEGAISVANGVVYTGSDSGLMYACDAASGKVLWSFDSGGSVIDGPSIADGVVYWGSGYNDSKAIANDKLYAFGLTPDR